MIPTKVKYKWTHLYTSRDPIEGKGNRIYQDQTKRLAIADNSGTLPHTTDDGALFIDITKIEAQGGLLASDYWPGQGLGCSVPVITEAGEDGYFAGFGPDGACWLARQLKVPIIVEVDRRKNPSAKYVAMKVRIKPSKASGTYSEFEEC